jgi:5'-nucleotidase
VLRIANESSQDRLDGEVRLDSRAAAEISKVRLGPDGKARTPDDAWFITLADLDRAAYVGPATFRKLANYAKTHPEYDCGVVDVQLLAFNDFHGNLKPPSGSSGRIQQSGNLVSMQGRNVIATRDVAKDTDQTTIITKYDAVAAPLANRVIGSIAGDLLKTPNAAGEASMGDVIADGQLDATKDTGHAQIAFMNIGGVRADMTVAQSSGGESAGQVTYGEAFTVQPFGNTMVTLTLSGDQLHSLLEQQWTMSGGAEKQAVLQVSAGFKYTWDSTKPIGSRVDPASMTLNGTPIVATQSYRVTCNGFLGDGGDGFSVFKSGTDRTPGGLDLDAMMSYFAAHSNLAVPASDRITKI